MKKFVGILGVAVISMLLGFSVNWARAENVSLLSHAPSSLFGN